jgi:hypothetical protein
MGKDSSSSIDKRNRPSGDTCMTTARNAKQTPSHRAAMDYQENALTSGAE